MLGIDEAAFDERPRGPRRRGRDRPRARPGLPAPADRGGEGGGGRPQAAPREAEDGLEIPDLDEVLRRIEAESGMALRADPRSTAIKQGLKSTAGRS